MEQRLNLQGLAREDVEEMLLRSLLEIQRSRRAHGLDANLALAIGALLGGAMIAAFGFALGAALN